jgi:hypothetical protein
VCCRGWSGVVLVLVTFFSLFAPCLVGFHISGVWNMGSPVVRMYRVRICSLCAFMFVDSASYSNFLSSSHEAEDDA